MSNRTEIAKVIQKALNKISEGQQELACALMNYSLDDISTPAPINTADTEAPAPDTINLDDDAPVAASDVIVDADNVPYNTDLHADKDKGKTGGKDQHGRWKMKRGADRSAYNAWRDQHKVEESTPAAATPPPPPGATPPQTAATPPPPPGATPPAPQSDNSASVKFNKDKAACIQSYKVLTEEFHIDNDDLSEEVAEMFSIPPTDAGTVDFSMMNFENTAKLRELWENRVEFYAAANAKIAEIYKWAAESKEYADKALAELYSNYNSESIQGVHYSDLESFDTDLGVVYNTWHQWAIDNKRA